jgi:hypothetical protein
MAAAVLIVTLLRRGVVESLEPSHDSDAGLQLAAPTEMVVLHEEESSEYDR